MIVAMFILLFQQIPNQHSDFVFPPRWDGVSAEWSHYLDERWNDAIDMYRFALWFYGREVRIEQRRMPKRWKIELTDNPWPAGDGKAYISGISWPSTKKRPGGTKIAVRWDRLREDNTEYWPANMRPWLLYDVSRHEVLHVVICSQEGLDSTWCNNALHLNSADPFAGIVAWGFGQTILYPGDFSVSQYARLVNIFYPLRGY